MNEEKVYLFSEAPVAKAIFSLAIPTVISQLITVVYNMGDTFFIGQLNDPRQVAAVTVIMPIFMLLTAFSNLFGLGGSSWISRCLGEDKLLQAKQCAVFCIWSGGAVAFFYGLGIWLLRPVLFPLLGVHADTWAFCEQYVFWTLGLGSLPTVLSAELAHLIRAEGYAKQAGFGIALGGILNVLLDPLFIFGFQLEIQGAAIATLLSNVVSLLYFFLFLYRIRNHTVITPHPQYLSASRSISKEVIMIGLPGFFMISMATLSNSILNHMIASYSNEAIAGMGIAKKMDLTAFAIAQGMAQGVLPLIGFCYASNQRKRMEEIIRYTWLYSFLIACVGMAFLFLSAVPLIRFFISDAETVRYGKIFLRILSLACPATAMNFMIITIFQATGQKIQPLFLSLLRKGSLDVIFMLLLQHIIGLNGIVWATPLADWSVFFFSLFLIIPYVKNLKSSLSQMA